MGALILDRRSSGVDASASRSIGIAVLVVLVLSSIGELS
jgi:hypothetical protein